MANTLNTKLNLKEFRPGNWIISKGKPYRVDSHAEFNAIWLDPTGCEPMPLTPEVLEKAGFELITWNGLIREYFTPVTKNGSCVLSFKFGEFRDDLHRLDSVTIGSSPHERGMRFGRFDVRYVHQLQNLYFALTGEELEIDLWAK